MVAIIVRQATATSVRAMGSAACVIRRWQSAQAAPASEEAAAPASKPKSSSRSAPNEATRYIGKTGGQIFHDKMLQHGVKHVFGYPGGAILPVFDAIYNSEHFDFILPRHEQGAGHMAEGYARASGKPGVVLVTSGPGATNTVTPLQDALMDGIPLVVFSGQVATHLMGSDAFQEADVIGITRSCTKWNVLVNDIADLPRRIDEAFEIATSGRPGPVLVDLPKDVTGSTLKVPATVHKKMPFKAFERPDSSFHMDGEDWERVANMINQAERPVLYVGQGVVSAGATEELRELARKANIPVTTTLQGMGAFDELDPRSLHMLGMHGAAYANFAVQEADVIVALGARFDDRVTGNLKKFAPRAFQAEKEGRGGIIHFEISRKNVNKVIKATEVVMGDVKDNLTKLNALVQSRPRKEWFSMIENWKRKHPFTYTPARPGGYIKPQTILEELNKMTQHMEKPAIYTTGVGQHQMWAAQFIRWRHPRTMITSGGLGTMGYGVPSAIGAKVAMPDSIVIDIDGDASFSMTMQELLTAAEYNIGIKVLVLNNHFQGMVKQWQDLFYDERYSATKMFNPDFAKVAEACGMKGLRIDRHEDIRPVLEQFLACDGPVVLDAHVERDEHVYPMVPAGSALHEMVMGPPPVGAPALTGCLFLNLGNTVIRSDCLTSG
eukprot:comp22417_c0_seq1/m.33564 comp22417_c0_seq1/g.33564  ORF comp22417_c0_seq1/g.33564 comp22417_c0_seq1/m.33564 type:complete len:665 (-) comp22417_c0_seq1:554-2548(-)